MEKLVRAKVRRKEKIGLGIICYFLVFLSGCFGYDVVVRDNEKGTGTKSEKDASEENNIWEELGGSASNGGVSDTGRAIRCKRIGVDQSGKLYALWSDDTSGVWEIYLKHWDGEEWIGLGGSDVEGGLSQGMGAPEEGTYRSCLGDIAFDSSGRTYVTWHNWLGDMRMPIYLRRWDGDTWEEVAGSASGEGISSGMSVSWNSAIVIDGSDRPIVGWQTGSNAFLRRLEGDTWSGIGGSDQNDMFSNDLGVESNIFIAAGVGERFYVGWMDDRTGGNEIYLLHWDGNTWQGLGGSDTSGGISTTGAASRLPRLRSHRGERPTLAWIDKAEDLYLRYFDGADWMGYDDISNLSELFPADSGMNTSDMALDPDGRPVVVWEQEDEVGVNIHGAMWDGTAWNSIDPPGARGGISNSSGGSAWPRVEVAPSGDIYVSWEQAVSEDINELYLRILRSN